MANPSASALPQDPLDFDFWEFVCCARCRMPFVLENGSATIPFWLTECGHVVCNNHLNRDQSCSQCGAQDIQVAPLQREMEPPMSEWFRSIPVSLDSIAFAAKFQQEAMAAQIRYHKSRHQQLRQLLERLKRELSDMKRSHDALQNENERYRRRFGPIDSGQEPSDLTNANGKRQMTTIQQFEQATTRPRTDSSPRTITTPLGPDRITLLPGQKYPELSSNKQHDHAERSHFQAQGTNQCNSDEVLQHRPVSNRSLERNQPQRPFSKRSLEQFAYSSRDNEVQKTHEMHFKQAAPPESSQYSSHRESNRPLNGQHLHTNITQPLPTFSRFKPASTTDPSTSFSTNAMGLGIRRQTNMGPPPTPQHARNKSFAPPDITSNDQSSANATNQGPDGLSVKQRAVVGNQGQQQYSAIGRRFLPQSSNGQSPFGTAPSRGDSRAQGFVPPMTPGQRTPFVPIANQRGRFG